MDDLEGMDLFETDEPRPFSFSLTRSSWTRWSVIAS